MSSVCGRVCELKKSQTLSYSKNHFYFQEHFFLFNYESEIRNKILQYKFQEKSYLYKTFAELFISDENFANFIKNYNLITCVPLHKKRYLSRGYNQSDLIAKEIAKHFYIPYCDNLLIKNQNIVAQSTLNKADRNANIKDAFCLNFNAKIRDFCGSCCSKKISGSTSIYGINNLKIAIFDDIFTTGSTANECAKVINHLAPNKIGIVTIAKD